MTTDGSAKKKRVVIVGGGLAGLSAAECLARTVGDRVEVTLLESKRRVGGRVGSFSDPASGETVDYCQHVAMGCCTNFLRLMHRCGLAEAFTRFSSLVFQRQHHVSSFEPSSWLPAPFHLSQAIDALDYLSKGQRNSIRYAMQQLMRATSESICELNALQWLEQIGQDDETIRMFWDVILVSALGERSEVVSMAAARKVLIDGFAAARGASDVYVPKVPLSELVGQQLCQAVAELGVEVKNECRVSGIDVERRAKQGHAGRVHTADEAIGFDHVIAAVPWNSVGKLTANVNEIDLAHAADIDSSPIMGVHLWFDEPITDAAHVVLVDSLAQWVFRPPFQQRGDATGYYYQVVISASGRHLMLDRDELVTEIVCDLAKAFPAARHVKLLRSRVVLDPHAVFSVSPNVQRQRPSASTALPCFHLAGDWIATGWPATMEGAVISGRMAAASVCKNERWNPPKVHQGLRRGTIAKLLIKS